MRRRTWAITPADGEADRDAADAADHELQPGLPSEKVPVTDGRDGDPVGDQRGAVVDQALALDDGDASAAATPSRRMIVVAATGSVGETMAPSANAAAHGRSGDERVGDDGDRDHRASTSPTTSSAIGRRFARRSRRSAKNAADVEQWRQEDDEDELRRELDVGQAGDEADQQAADDEHDRVRDVDGAGGRGQHGHRNQEADEDELDVVDPGRLVPLCRLRSLICLLLVHQEVDVSLTSSSKGQRKTPDTATAAHPPSRRRRRGDQAGDCGWLLLVHAEGRPSGRVLGYGLLLVPRITLLQLRGGGASPCTTPRAHGACLVAECETLNAGEMSDWRRCVY